MKHYTIARDGEELGTWDADTVWAKIAAGQILPTDHAWADGMADWSTVSRLFPTAPPPPAPAPLPQSAPAPPTTSPAGFKWFKFLGMALILVGLLMFFGGLVDGGDTVRAQPKPFGYRYLTGFFLLGGLFIFVVARFED